MPEVDTTPKYLKPLTFHGVAVHWNGDEQANGECPLCGKEGKFYVKVATGLWDCKSCGESGNPLTFVRKLWELSERSPGKRETLAADRGLLWPASLGDWGVCKSAIAEGWLVPGYAPDGKLVNVYRYTKVRGPGGWRTALFPTPGLTVAAPGSKETGHGLHGVPLFDPDKPDVYLFEGVWDAIAAWEVMRVAKRADDGSRLTLTANQDNSVYATANVLATPSATVFKEEWRELFANKRVFLAFDSDHPRTAPNGKEVPPTGYAGMKRVAEMLVGATTPPREIHYLHWGEDGYDPERKSGWDVRDLLQEGGSTPAGRVAALGNLLGKFRPIPGDWAPGRTAEARRTGGTEYELVDCRSYKALVNQWRKALKWTEGLDRALAAMLAVAASTKAAGDNQLWVRVISPASTGKTTLCEALATNRRYVLPKDTMTGLFSGFQVDGEGKEDLSLVPKLNGKTLVIKDADTVVKLPNREQVLSQFRALYDRSLRTQFKNRMSRDYESISCTVIVCGTTSLYQLDSSDLGERFLTVVIMEEIDDDLEEQILWRVVNRTDRNLSYEANGKPETQHDPDQFLAMRMTGGYLNWLRENAQRLLDATEGGDDEKRLVTRYGRFVSFMRARPSKAQDEVIEREFAARLVSQLWRLAKCLAVVMNRRTVDDEVMARVRRVALDSARGKVFDVAKLLYAAGDEGVMPGKLVEKFGGTDESALKLLMFMRSIQVVEAYRSESMPGVSGPYKWRLTKKVRGLYEEVVPGTSKFSGEGG